MKTPQKHWSWGAALGRGVGGALGAGGAGGVIGTLGGPGISIVAGIGAAGGFAGGFLGYVLGHWWDDPPELPEPFGSAALFMSVVGGGFSSLLWALLVSRMPANPEMFEYSAFAIASFSTAVASLSKSLIDDIRTRRRIEHEEAVMERAPLLRERESPE